MKKHILTLAVLSFTLFSCGDTSGGNKNVIPADAAITIDSPENIVETPSTTTQEGSQAVNNVSSDSTGNASTPQHNH